MKREKSVEIRVSRDDHREWKAQAKKNGLSLSEYCRRRINSRPLKARRPKASAKMRDVMSPDELAELDQMERQEHDERRAKEKAAHEREEEAIRLAKSAGGVERWFSGMSPQAREQWADLKEFLLKSERLHKEAEESWRAFSSPTDNTDASNERLARNVKALEAQRKAQADAEQEIFEKVGIML